MRPAARFLMIGGEHPMATYEDGLALGGLTAEQVDLIAARERLPRLVALELAGHLLETTEGRQRLRRILGEDTGAAQACDGGRGDTIPGVTAREAKRLAA
jgi:hypothetical protein